MDVQLPLVVDGFGMNPVTGRVISIFNTMELTKEYKYNVSVDKLLSAFILFGITVLYLVVPSINNNDLMHGTQSGKSFVFIYLLLIIISISLLYYVLQKRRISVEIGWLDVSLFLYISYIILRNGITYETIYNIRFLELVGLSIIYLLVRRLTMLSYGWIVFALILGGLIQSIYGNLQLWGYYPSNHGMFKMTGSFFNPGPYAGYLSCVFPLAFGCYLFKIDLFPSTKSKSIKRHFQSIQLFLKGKFEKAITIFLHFAVKNNRKEPLAEEQHGESKTYKIIHFSIILTVVLILLVLPASRSRAAWLAVFVSSAYLLLVKYSVFKILKKYFNSGIKKVVVTVLGVILLGIGASGLYFLKKDSTDGRLLIWKVSINMIKEKPITGFGFDQFKSLYMDYQAAYFKQNPDSVEAMVAGDTNYTFNELLQQTVELGIVGLFIIVLILIIAFQSPKIQDPKFEAPSPQVFKQENGIFFEQGQINSMYQLITVSKAGIISIFVFSLFSYPAQILPIKLNLVFYLAVLSVESPGRKFVLAENTNRKTLFTVLKTFFAVVSFVFLCFVFKHTQKLKIAYTNWESAYQVYQMGAYDACLKDFEKAWPLLKNNGAFLTNYGKALSMAEEHQKAVEVLQQAGKKYPNTVANTSIGDSYKNTGQYYKAEQAYLQAWYMNPSRFYPKYLLAKLYDESGQNQKANLTAQELLKKEIKIESTAIEEIKEEMITIINK
jgi:O-antigen polymerase